MIFVLLPLRTRAFLDLEGELHDVVLRQDSPIGCRVESDKRTIAPVVDPAQQSVFNGPFGLAQIPQRFPGILAVAEIRLEDRLSGNDRKAEDEP